jgi:tRNA dimethylallyltransferase
VHGLPIEIVNADALQVYRGLDAATAKPAAADRASVPCHLVDWLDATEACSAGRWVEAATAAIHDVTARGNWPLVVGGTGLYLRALTVGLAQIPPPDPVLRQKLARLWQQGQGPALHAELAAVDPAYAARTPASNRQRVVRALEVWRQTGRTFSEWHATTQPPLALATWTCVVDPDAEAHRQIVAARARGMAGPLLAEVQALIESGLLKDAPGLQALGYRDAVACLDEGRADAETALADRLAALHVQYARRQRTWFKAVPAQLRLAALDEIGLETLATGLRAWFG